MKKLYYLLSFIAVAMSFTACHPLDNTYKELGDLPVPGNVVSANLTLSTADYGILPSSNYAKTSFNFRTVADAKASIPTILASKYPNYSDKSSVLVTYANAPLSFKAADSVFNNIVYTVTTDDYTNGSSAAGNGTFKSYSSTQVLAFLGWKYPNAVANQLVLLTYTYFESGATPSAGVPATDTFIYLNGLWTKIYTVSVAQYTSVGRGSYLNFTTNDNPTIPSWINAFLKADASVAATAKAGDVKYVSFKHFKAATGTSPNVIPAVTSQRVAVLTFDGTNWVTTATPATPMQFSKTNGVWVADNTINYSLAAADYTYISTLTFGSDAARGNLAQYKNFNITNGAPTGWTSAQINDGIAAWLKSKYPAAEQNQIFNITYYAYSGSYSYITVKYKYVGTTFVVQ